MTATTVSAADASTFEVSGAGHARLICLTVSRPTWSMDTDLTPAEARELAAALVAAADEKEVHAE